MFEVFGLGAEFTFDAKGTEGISDLVGNLARLDRQMDRSAEQTLEYSATMDKFAASLGALGRTTVATGLIQTTAALYGVGKAAKWQTEMVDASRYMSDDSTKAQVAYNRTLKETAQLLGRTKEEINSSVVSYMMMGKSTDEALRLAKNAGYAAVTWSMTADSVANSFRSIKAAFNINLEDQAMYQRYLDTINEVGNRTAATSADVISFLADGGAALHNVANVSIEQAMGMASAARYANMSIAEFSTMMTRLGNQYAQDKSSKYFKSLGVSVKDAKGQMRSFADVLYDVQQKWEGMDQATKSSFVSNVGGVYADRLSLYMGSGEEYQKGQQIANQDNTGSAKAEFSRVTATFAMAMSRLKVTLNDFNTAFWGTLLKPLTRFVSGVDAVMKAFSNFAQGHPLVMKMVAGFILLSGIMLVVLGTGLLLTSMFAKLKASQILGHFATLRASLTMHGLGVVFKGVGTQVVALTSRFLKLSLSIGLIYLAWKYDLFNIRSMFEEFFSKMKLSFESAKKLLDRNLSLEKFKDSVASLENSNSVFDKLALGIAKVGLAFQSLTDYFSKGFISDDMFSRLQTMGLVPLISIIIGLQMRFSALFKGIKEGFIDTITNVNTWVRDKFGPPLQWLHDHILLPVADAIFGVKKQVDGVADSTNGIQFVNLDKMFGKIETWEAIGKALGKVAAALLILKTASSIINGLAKVGSMLGTVGNFFLGIGRFIGPALGAFGRFGSFLITNVGTWASILGTTFSEIIAGTTTIGAAFSEMFPMISSAFSGIGTVISGVGSAIMWVLGLIGTIVTAVLGFFGIVVSAPAWLVGLITVAIAAIIGAIYHFRDEIWNFLTVTVPNAVKIGWDAFTNWLTALPEQIGYAVGFLIGKIYLFFTETLPSALDSARETLGRWVTNIGNFFTVTIPEFFVACGVAIGNFFTVTLPEFLDKAKETILRWGDNIKTFFTVTLPEFFVGLPEKFRQFAIDVANGFTNGINELKEAGRRAIEDYCQGLIKGFKDALGIHSPSTVALGFGVNLIEGFNNGVTSMKGTVGTIISGITGTIAETLGNMKSTAHTWGSNMVSGFIEGMQSTKKAVGDAAGGVTKTVKGWMGFNSPSKEGEGRHIVEWGYNMVSGFTDGIISARSLLQKTMSDMISNPVSDIISGGMNVPLTTNSNFDVTANQSNELFVYLGAILNGIALMTNAVVSLTDIKTGNGSLSNEPLNTIVERVKTAETSIIQNKTGGMNIVIEAGAIHNSFSVESGEDREAMLEMLSDMLDDELLPLLLRKIRELKTVLND